MQSTVFLWLIRGCFKKLDRVQEKPNFPIELVSRVFGCWRAVLCNKFVVVICYFPVFYDTLNIKLPLLYVVSWSQICVLQLGLRLEQYNMFCCTYFQHIVCDKFYNNDFFLLVFKAKRSRSLGGRKDGREKEEVQCCMGWKSRSRMKIWLLHFDCAITKKTQLIYPNQKSIFANADFFWLE